MKTTTSFTKPTLLLPILALYFLTFASPAKAQDFMLRVEATDEARALMAEKWGDAYSLQIFKGFNEKDTSSTKFNTIWQTVPKSKLQECSDAFELQFSNPIKVSFKTSVRNGEVIKTYKIAQSEEFGVGKSVTFDRMGKWSEARDFEPDNELEVINNGNFIYKSILYSKGSTDEYKPFYVSPNLIPNSALQGSPVLKLALRFGQKLSEAAFLGDIEGKDVEVLDFTLDTVQTACIDVKPYSEVIYFQKGSCA